MDQNKEQIFILKCIEIINNKETTNNYKKIYSQKIASIINNQQNFEDQYFENLGVPVILCNSHQNKVQEFINTNNLNENKLACAKCVIKDKLNHDFLISIDEIFSNNPNNIISYWPPLQDQTIYQYLVEKDVQQSINNSSIKQINKYFDILKVDFLKTIEDHQKQLLAHINSIEANRQRVIDVYNEISSKEEIKNEFLKNKNNQQQLQQNLKQIISTKQTQSTHNQSIINNAINIFTKVQQQFEFQYIQNIFNQCLNDLKSIDVLNPLLTIEQQLSSRISEKKNNNDEENQLILKVDKIMNLINNKSNFCNLKFLQNMKEILMMNKQIFTQIDLNNPFLGENQPIQFGYLQQNELQQLSCMVKYLNNEIINTQSNNQIQEQISRNKNFEFILMTMQYVCKENNEKKIVEEMKQNNVQSGQQEGSQIESNINEIDLLQSLKLIKSNYDSPVYISFKKIENNNFLIERKSNSINWQQVIIESELIVENKYQIQIDLKENSNNEIMIGLLPISQKDLAGWESKLSLYLFKSGLGIDLIESGMHISEFRKDVKQISIQICLQEKILRCLCVDRNNIQNINSLDDFNKISPNEKYYFYIALGFGEYKTEISQFKIVQQFNQW